MIGLVLTGGGARGAYQVGALRYLAECGIEPDIIVGTSIGALNGAVLSSNAPFEDAAIRLEYLWERLGQVQVIRPSRDFTLRSLSYGLSRIIPQTAQFRDWLLDFLKEQGIVSKEFCIFDSVPLEDFILEAVDPAKLMTGIELWVTIFPSLNIPFLNYNALSDFIRAKAGVGAEWLCAQEFAHNRAELYNVLLASAAIPLAFPRREIQGKMFVDGGLADNLPIGALIKRGCRHIVVIHLSNASVWNKNDFPEQTIIEIRPQQNVIKSNMPVVGYLRSLLDFSSERINELKEQGYSDAKNCLKIIKQTLQAVQEQRDVHDDLIESTKTIVNKKLE